MRWSDRQRAMLGEMGIRLWPEPADAEPADERSAVLAQALIVPRSGEAEAASAPAHPVPMRAVPQAIPRHMPTEAAITVAPRPQAAEIAAMDWPELREAVAACTACRLCQGRKQTVFGVGNPQAHWMIVGEAPGEQEDLQGEPFVGKSGQLLDNMLRAIGLTRESAPPPQQVYIANTLKCRPPGNRNPQPDELARCEPFLIRQVELVKPKIILAMGRFAVQSLLRSTEPIGRLRGRVHDYQGVPLIVTYHPAYLLRSLEEKARAWDDLCLAVETVKACTAG
jgi:DNA polymerase